MEESAWKTTLRRLLEDEQSDDGRALRDIGRHLGQNIPSNQVSQLVEEMVESSPESTKEAVARGALATLNPEQVQRVTSGLSAPSKQTRDWIWRTVVGAFSLVMVLTVLVMIAGMFLPKQQDNLIASELIFSIFTAATGFLAGLFVKSPNDDS